MQLTMIIKTRYLIVLAFAALLINENVVQWALAIYVGGYSVTAGFADAYEYFTVSGYLFFTAFRLIPYVILSGVLALLSITKQKDYVLPVFVGGLLGILAMILWGSWEALRPIYTSEHVSSTTAVAFLFIPFYASGAGIIGAGLSAAVYTPVRHFRNRA